jgi:indole-3-acetate monooxygenase
MGTTVVACDGGYRFSGKSTFASGSAQATWLTAAGFALRDGAPQFVNGVPIMRAGMLPVRECKILDTWSVSGLRGTGSNDFVFNDVVVPESFTFEWPEPQATWATGAVAHIPLQTQLAGGFVAVALGIARHAIEFLKELAVAKVPLGSRASLRERPLAQIQLAQAEGCLLAARAYFYQTVAEIWRRGEAGTGFDLQARAHARLAPLTAVRLAAQAVDLVYDAAGITAIQTSSPIERCWRDVHAVTQQIQISSARYETVGRVLFGLDPAGPIL